MKTLAIFLFVLLPSLVHSWGFQGHSYTGAIAQHFLTDKVKRVVSHLLPDKFHGHLSEAASWADQIKRRKMWSYTMHFIDTHFQTPDETNTPSCIVDIKEDCPTGVCVVTAISNYTQRLLNITEENTKERPLWYSHFENMFPWMFSKESHRKPSMRVKYKEATSEDLLFLIHFIGDVHQPLHTLGKLRGGNGYPVKFSKGFDKPDDSDDDDDDDDDSGFHENSRRRMNMHYLWDTALLDKRIRKHYKGSSYYFIGELFKKMEHGEWANEKYTWLDCPVDPTDDVYRPHPLVCPLHWAQTTGQLNCETVWVGVDGTHKDLGFEYYERNAPIIEKQLAMAGYRMASVLNALFDHLDESVIDSLVVSGREKESRYTEL